MTHRYTKKYRSCSQCNGFQRNWVEEMGFAVLKCIGQTVHAFTCSEYRFNNQFLDSTMLKCSFGFRTLYAEMSKQTLNDT